MLASTLFQYVRDAVKALRLPAGGAAGSIQVPQMNTEIGDLGRPDPLIVRLRAKEVKPVELIVAVDPRHSPPPPPARVEVKRDDRVVAGQEWEQRPLQFTLPQRDYRITTVSDVYAQEPDPVVVNLYAPVETLLNWRRKEPAAPPQSTGPVGRRRKARLTVSSIDPVAPVEIVAESGNVIAHGLGAVVDASVKPGFYTARLRIPDRRPVEQSVYLDAEDVTYLRLPAPRLKGPVVDQLIPRGIALRVGGEAVEVSEMVGPMVAPRIGTVLGLAAVFGDFPEQPASVDYRLSLLGVGESSWYQNLDVLVELAEESAAPDSVFMRVWAIGDPSPETTLQTEALAMPSAARGRAELQPGMHWLALDLPQRSRLVLPVAIFEEEITRVVVEVPPEGPATLVMYHSRPGFDQFRLRLVDLFERTVMAGQFDSSVRIAEALHRAGWTDPIARAIEGSLRLRLRQVAKVRSIAEGLVTAWPLLSDGWALLGLADTLPIELAAAQALDAGIPVVSETARALNASIQASDTRHPSRELLAQVVATTYPGSFWTAWAG